MEKVTLRSLQEKKKNKIPITTLTCYDAFSGRLVDFGGVDIALVGDSLANTRLGYPNTLPITVDEMLHHTQAASRGVKRALLVADLPFMAYEALPQDAAKTAGRFIKEGRAEAVKVEGGKRIGPSVAAMVRANIPVMGHVGLTPQSVNIQSGFRVQGKKAADAKRILDDALFLQRAGVFSLVLEGIPMELARKITRALKIPTIGIGAGPYCDGQVLVLDDLLGFGETPSPKFVKRYASLRKPMVNAIQRYVGEVRARKFPTKEFSY
jgi:3-methyl-2-oxobutanoate hydroxymethyltransferase